MKRFFAAFFLMLLCLSALPAQAQDQVRVIENLTEMNRIQPLQNPLYHHADDLLKRRILDRKMQVIGQTLDVIVNKNGLLESLYVDFDRLHLSNPVYLQYKKIEIAPSTNGFALALDREQIEGLYPALLGEIETAAGAEDTLSLRRLNGAPLEAKDGRRLGTIENVLFSKNGGQAQALYVLMNYGTLRKEPVAIPFGLVEFDTGAYAFKARVSDDFADTLIDFSKSR